MITKGILYEGQRVKQLFLLRMARNRQKKNNNGTEWGKREPLGKGKVEDKKMELLLLLLSSLWHCYRSLLSHVRFSVLQFCYLLLS